MSVELNHTVVQCLDKHESARFLADLLDLEVGADWGPFTPVTTSNGVTLDFATAEDGAVTGAHYAFLVSDAEFDAAFERIRGAGITYYADPHQKQPGEINHLYGGRGLYFLDPSGHIMEIITQPYGDEPA